jgi:spermidine synthase
LTHPENKPDPPLKLILLLFYLSGALALVYEVVWSRMLMQVFGSTALAVGTVLAAWMSGMALGAWLIGKRADRSRHGLRLYAQLEIGIAVFALLAHLALSRISPVHLALHDLLGSMPGLYAASRFLLAFALVLVPTLLMGATLPVLTRYLVESRESVGIRLSTLYFFNTLGAVSGVLLTGFYLVGNFGIHQPVYMAVAGNLLIGGLAWMTSMLHSATPSRPASLQQADRDADRQLMGTPPTR